LVYSSLPNAAELLALAGYAAALLLTAVAMVLAALLAAAAAGAAGCAGTAAALAQLAWVALGRLVPALLALWRATGAVAATDLLLDCLRNLAQPSRRARCPCAWWLRPAAACEAWAIKVASEAGRLAGHLGRRGRLVGGWLLVGRRFDWFCGMDPGVVRAERWRAALRFACFVAATAVAVGGVAS
jgi:hypothetical protein